MQSVGKEIKKILKENKISMYRMAKDLEITKQSLYQSLSEDGNPEWKRIKQILDYLHCEIIIKSKKERR